MIPEPHVTVTHIGPVFRVERLRFARPRPEQGGAGGGADGDGDAERSIVKDVVRHPGAVAVVAERGDGRLVVIRNNRVAVGRALVEFCAGKLEPGEDPAHAAARELEEETGYAAGALVRLGEFFTSPGFTDERMHVYLATDLRPVPQRLEPGEEIEVFAVTRPELEAGIARGEIVDGKTLGAYLLWRLSAGEPPGGRR